MELIASIFSFIAFIAAWLYTVKQLSTVSALLRHSLGALVGAVTLLVVVLMFVFIGVIAPQGKHSAAAAMQAEPVAAMQSDGHKCPPYKIMGAGADRFLLYRLV